MTGQLSQEALGLLKVKETKTVMGLAMGLGMWCLLSVISQKGRDNATAFPVSIGEQKRVFNAMHLFQPTPFVLLITNTYCRRLSGAAVIAGLV